MDSDGYASDDGYSDDEQFSYGSQQDEDTMMSSASEYGSDGGTDMAFDADAEVQPVLRKARLLFSSLNLPLEASSQYSLPWSRRSTLYSPRSSSKSGRRRPWAR